MDIHRQGAQPQEGHHPPRGARDPLHGCTYNTHPSQLFHSCKKLTYLDKVETPNPKSESFLKINPNGRVPAIEDPNTGIAIWESGAILEYLIEKYDKEYRFSFAAEPERWYLKQYLHFQMSGQGPYYGQVM